MAVVLGAVTAGCLNLKPTEDPTRYFLLTRAGSAQEASTVKGQGPALGIAQVDVPVYLTKPWMVVRTSETEIRYSDFNKWGEHLDKGIQRVLSEQLTGLLGTDRVYRNFWNQDDVDIKVKLSVHKFEVDLNGRAVLEAQWQITGERVSAGHRVIEKVGPAPNADAAGAVQTMSEALAELSRVIATEIQP